MDVWHWTPLVALLCFAGLRAIPDAYYQAARIDGASKFAVFRYIQLPKLRGVLMIAVLLRFMDSFMIYTEPFVLTGGGPGQRHHLPEPVPDAEGGRPVRPGPGGGLLADLLPDHPAAVLHPLQLDAARGHGRQGRRPAMMSAASRSGCLPDRLPGVRHPAGVLDGQHELQDQRGDPVRLQPVAARLHAGATTAPSSPMRAGTRATSTPDLRGHQHGDLAHGGAAGGLCLQPLLASWATSMCSSGC
jgi:hypothetical protein